MLERSRLQVLESGHRLKDPHVDEDLPRTLSSVDDLKNEQPTRNPRNEFGTKIELKGCPRNQDHSLHKMCNVRRHVVSCPCRPFCRLLGGAITSISVRLRRCCPGRLYSYHESLEEDMRNAAIPSVLRQLETPQICKSLVASSDRLTYQHWTMLGPGLAEMEQESLRQANAHRN